MIKLKSLFPSLIMTGMLCMVGCKPSEKGGPQATEAEKVKNPVSGQLTMEGGRSPLRCMIQFVKPDQPKNDDGEILPVASGAADSYGYFQMTTNTANDGCPPGKYKVLFFQSASIPKGTGKASPIDALGGKYQDPETAIEVDIPAGGKTDLSFKVEPLPQEEIDALLSASRDAAKNRGSKSRNDRKN